METEESQDLDFCYTKISEIVEQIKELRKNMSETEKELRFVENYIEQEEKRD